MPRRTGLIVPVPAAAPYYVSELGVPAHVTILFPFVDPGEVDEKAIRDVLSAHPPFDFALDRTERWPHGSVLLPSPAEPFVAMTHAVWERWPEHPPYEGIHDTIVPHVSLTVDDPPLTLRDRATEVLLVEEEEPGGRFATRLRFPLS